MHLGHVQRWMARRRVEILDTLVLCARPGARTLGTHLDFVAHDAPNSVLAGYGLQLRSDLATRPDIVALRTPHRGQIENLLLPG
jgi:hypoxanthine-guanine phosphoribosyltransferase